MSPGVSGRWAWAEVDLGAVDHNVRLLAERVTPAAVWVVVKADGYGHGAVAVGRRALEAGAAGLAVALVDEGLALRAGGIDDPVLVLSEQPAAQLTELVDAHLIATVYSEAGLRELAAVAPPGYPVHVKVDTGMHRVGVQWEHAADLVALIATDAPHLRVEGLFTHLACADEPSSPATATQLVRFETVLDELDRRGLRPAVVHAANSAGALAAPTARFSLVRAGIAVYGISPGPGVDHLAAGLRPVMSLRARVSHVKRVRAGAFVSYGWRHRFERDTTVATVPCGYADGVPRRLGSLPDRPGTDVLIGGRRCPIVGVVTMDQFVADVSALDRDGAPGVAVGDEVTLIGTQGDEQIRAEDWADRLGTIGYEVVCGVSKRIARIVRDRDAP